MICAFTVCLYLFFGGGKMFFMMFGILLLGISSRVMLGLSPTVFASSYRTYLFLNISFMIVAVAAYKDVINSVLPKTARWINAAMITVAAVNFLALPFGYEIVKHFFNRP